MSTSWRHRLRSLLPLLVLTLGCAYALASWNWCGRWPERAPAVLERVRASGPLRAGAARVALAPPYPVVVAGYGMPRPEAQGAGLPPQARALVLAVGDVKVGLVSLELMLVPVPLVAAVRERAAALGLDALWVVASHSHSSFGGYDARLVSELSGTGRFRQASLDAAARGAAEALTQAASQLTDVTLEWDEARAPELVRARSGGPEPEGVLTRVGFRGAVGPVGELLVFSAHPTLVPRKRDVVDPDWPGRVSQLREEAGGVTVVLQGAAGNVSAVWEASEGLERVTDYARAVAALAERAVPVPPSEGGPGPTTLGWARVSVALPRPDASRLVPGYARAAGDNLLCASSERSAEVSALRLGPLRWVLVPGEPTAEAGAALLRRTGATGLLGLVDGYVGYVDTAERVAAREGEARRQYFGPVLLERLGAGVERAAREAGFTP